MADISIQDWANIRTPSFSYVDDSLSIKTTTTVFEQGFSFTQANALINLNAQTTNNYNMLYLTSRYQVSDIVELDTLDYGLQSLTTYLRFRGANDSYKYIKFEPNSYSLADSEELLNDSTRFQLKFIDDRNVQVKHVSNNNEYKLCINTDDSVRFSLSGTTTDYTLKYIVDQDGYLTLYKNSVPTKLLTLVTNSLVPKLLSAGKTTRTSNEIIEISNSFTPLTYNIDQNWVSYDRTDLNLASIDSSRSAFGLRNQFLITSSYNNIGDTIDINFINLKNNVSEGNFIKRGSILNAGPLEQPGVDFRFYTSLNTGNIQEKGNENIVLSYVFYDKDIVAKAGTDTAFSTSETIYPYDRLNINDSKLIANGAYGSYAPNISDNIYKLRKNSTGFNNGRYLCTWLSGNGAGDNYMWADRYYYPNIVSKEAAYTTPTFQPSFLDPIDTSAYAFAYKQEIINTPIFDKKSDFFFEPNTNYIYRRVSADDLQNHISSLSAFSVYTKIEPVRFDSNTSIPIEIDAINSSGEFSITFDLYLKPNRTYGHSILGNLTNFGFSVLNDTFITPIIISLSGNNTLQYYNTYPRSIGSQLFKKRITDVVRFDSLDNYYVLCTSDDSDCDIYTVRYDNTIACVNSVSSVAGYNSVISHGTDLIFQMGTSGNIISYDTITGLTTANTAASPFGTPINSIFYGTSSVFGVKSATLTKKYDTSSVCFLSSGTICKYDFKTDVVTPIVKTNSILTDYSVDKNGNYLIVHNTDRFTLLNKNRKVVFTQSLSAIPLSGYKCDFIRQFDFGQITERIAIAGTDIYGTSQVAMYDYEGIMRGMTSVDGQVIENFSNYNYHLDQDQNSKLKFEISLENLRDNSDIMTRTLSYDYSNISEGFVNLSYSFDSLNGRINLYVNGAIHDTASFEPAKYKITDIFSDRIIVGATGFYNGITLSEFLGQPNYYYVNDTIIRNLNVYSKALKSGDFNAINLLDSDIQPITLSIPCGQRNNIEEIIRYFKFSVPGSVSNHINIEVKNSGITDTALQSAIKTDIRQNISRYIKSDVIIDDIIFVDYSV